MQLTVRNISDTARWVAYFRALEGRRSDALFCDPHAERLAGERGFEIANTLPDGNKHEWAWVARTYLFDRFISQQVQRGAEVVLNLAAGLDARPYRMDLPSTLEWVEVDMPEIIAYKEEMLQGEKAKFSVTRYGLDLSDVEKRRTLFAELASRRKTVTVASEGLLIYLSDPEVAALARDLSETKQFQSWIIDITSPGQLRLMQRMSKQLAEAGAPFKFAPPQGAKFFAPHGWIAISVEGLLKTAAKFNRPPAELLSLLPEPRDIPPNYPWSGVCLLEKS